MTAQRTIVAGLAMALVLALSAESAHAAWWPFSKRDKNTTQSTPPATDTAPATAPPGSANGGDRIGTLEAAVRTLTGQVEELTYQLRQLQDQLAAIQGSADGTTKMKKQAAVPTPANPPAPASSMLVVADPAAPAPATGAGTPPANLGQLTVAANGESPIDLSATTRGTTASAPLVAPVPTPAAEAAKPKPDVLASLGDPRADYEAAYNNIITGNYERAEASFRMFLSAHPDDERASDAQYWLGESLFQRGKYRDAATEFLAGHNAYPNSPKAPDTLLKLGVSLAGMGERDAACQTYLKVLKQYPQATKSLRQRVAVEQASASC